jgi:hypothetical protein
VLARGVARACSIGPGRVAVVTAERALGLLLSLSPAQLVCASPSFLGVLQRAGIPRYWGQWGLARHVTFLLTHVVLQVAGRRARAAAQMRDGRDLEAALALVAAAMGAGLTQSGVKLVCL